jgi:hypothetical protein
MGRGAGSFAEREDMKTPYIETEATTYRGITAFLSGLHNVEIDIPIRESDIRY